MYYPETLLVIPLSVQPRSSDIFVKSDWKETVDFLIFPVNVTSSKKGSPASQVEGESSTMIHSSFRIVK